MWYRQTRWKPRLSAEVVAMREHFPDFVLQELPDAGLHWLGILRPLGDREFVVALAYPVNYPYAAPRLWVLDPPLHGDAPHVYSDGSLCVHASNWDPNRGTAASCVPLVAGWLVAYINWCRTGMRF